MKRLLMILLFPVLAFGQNFKPMMGTPINIAHHRGDPIGAWLFNEGAGNKAFDLSGNGRNGTFTGDTAWVVGNFGHALDFDGAGDYVDTGWNPTAGQYSVVSWWKWDSLAGAGNFDDTAMGCHDAANHRFYFGTADGNYYFGAGDSFKGSTGHSFATGVWYFLVYTMDGSTSRYYVDGVEVDNDAYSWSGTSSLSFLIGDMNYAALDRYIDGQIDHVIIYNYVLSASGIDELYANSFCMFESDDVSLMALESPAAPGGQVITIQFSSIFLIITLVCIVKGGKLGK